MRDEHQLQISKQEISDRMRALKKHKRDLESSVDNETKALLLQKIGHFSKFGESESSQQIQTPVAQWEADSILENEEENFEALKQSKVFANRNIE